MLNDLQRANQLATAIAGAAAFKSQCRQRLNGVIAAHDGAIRRFKSPDRADDFGVDAIGVVDECQQALVLKIFCFAVLDARWRHGAVKIVPDAARKFWLIVVQFVNARIDEKIVQRSVEDTIGNTSCGGLGAKASQPALKICRLCRCGGENCGGNRPHADKPLFHAAPFELTRIIQSAKNSAMKAIFKP